MQWYVLHVRPGTEREVQRRLQLGGIDAAVPQEEAVIRRGGRWQTELRVLFPGYVFVFMQYTIDKHYVIKAIPGAIRLLPKTGPPQPLLEREAAWMMRIYGEALSPSRVAFGGEQPVVLDGPLKDLREHIVRFDRHRRKVYLRIPVLGEERDVTLSVLPV